MQSPGASSKARNYYLNYERDVAMPFSVGLVVIIMLSVDSLNPVKILCSYTGGVVCQNFLSAVASFWLVWLSVVHAQQLVYYALKIFLRSSLNNLFFQSVEVIGMDSLPRDGPVILVGNHNNQFVDAGIMLTNCSRRISFMIAEKSFKRPVIGWLARAFSAIPVVRAQDYVTAAPGKVRLNGTTVVAGEGTQFTASVKPGDQLIVKDARENLKVKAVVSDTELELESSAPEIQMGLPVDFKVCPRVDQSAMYANVFDILGKGGCLGIFPEGGSHDRTDLLPLKAGVAIIALEANIKHQLTVPIVPVGLNYFRGHRFRGRCVVEFGTPMLVSDEYYAKYEENKREATDLVLRHVQQAMRSVIVPAPSFKALQIIYTARRLYVQDGLRLSAVDTMALNRHFAKGYSRLLKAQDRESKESDDESRIEQQQSDGDSEGSELVAPSEVGQRHEGLAEEVANYMQSLKKLGLTDHQLQHVRWWTASDIAGRFLYLVTMFALGFTPSILFNWPASLIARSFARKEQQKALRSSSVKIAARDVLMSYKVIYCLVLVPMLYVFYIILLLAYSGLTYQSIALLAICFPLFSIFGAKASEHGVRAYTDIMPLVYRMNPRLRREQDELSIRRARLQKKVRKIVDKTGLVPSSVPSDSLIGLASDAPIRGKDTKKIA